MTILLMIGLASTLNSVCVAVGFTPVTHGLSWANTQVVAEITVSIRDRYDAINASYVADDTDDRVPGDDATTIGPSTNDQSWLEWQNMLEALPAHLRYIDPDQPIVGQPRAVTSMTLAAWRIKAGITNGFRRATSYDPAADAWTDYADPMYSYGTIQEGDVMGPWIVQDLQDGISAYSVAVYRTVGDIGRVEPRNKWDQDIGGADCDIAWTNACIAYAAKSWTDPNPFMFNIYRAFVLIDVLSPTSSRFTNSRELAKPTLMNIWTGAAHTADIYLMPTVQFPDIFHDWDHLGWEEDKWAFHESLSSATTASRTGNLVTAASPYSIDDAPMTNLPFTCSSFFGSYIESDTEITTNDVMFVLDWGFTYSN